MIRDHVTELADAPLLPRMQPAQQRALNRLYDTAPALPFDCAGLAGELVFMPFRGAPSTLDAAGRTRFRLGAHAGTLCLDTVGCARLVGERHVARLPAELRTILLADALQPLVQRLEAMTRLHFEWRHGEAPAPADIDGALGFEVLPHGAGDPGVRGVAVFDDPAALDGLVPAFEPRRAALRQVWDALRVPLRFSLGTTPIALREVRRIAAGDVIGVERWTSRGSALQVRAVVAGRHGIVLTGLADGPHITLESIGEPAMNRDSPTASGPGADDDAATLPLDRLDALEVVLRFEVGELSLTLGELKALRPGHVFDLTQPLNRCTVRILAHGNVLGQGSLVAVGDRLGVRVAEFAAGAL
ncbi:MAG TPA: type III secretion system cytoplasmic ring protein SctQ [Albitalea sp.]|uniref:type III secretion system cytoplasmic ring protein SctQ n=1 Tax=Piscinibacter sp. TaxID=1903157 RepID=UPI002ED03286